MGAEISMKTACAGDGRLSGAFLGGECPKVMMFPVAAEVGVKAASDLPNSIGKRGGVDPLAVFGVIKAGSFAQIVPSIVQGVAILVVDFYRIAARFHLPNHPSGDERAAVQHDRVSGIIAPPHQTSRDSAGVTCVPASAGFVPQKMGQRPFAPHKQAGSRIVNEALAQICCVRQYFRSHWNLSYRAVVKGNVRAPTLTLPCQFGAEALYLQGNT